MKLNGADDMARGFYELILWDFDGTLADTLTNGVSIYNQLAKRHGFNPITDPASLRDLKSRDILKRLRIPFWKMPWLMNQFVAMQKEAMPEIRLFPGIEVVLTNLRDSGKTLGIVSSNSEESIRICLQANRVEHLFSSIVGYAKVFGKHVALKKTIKQTSLNPRQILYIGDEVRDIEAARRVNIDVASVTWGWHSRALLSEHDPAFLIDEPVGLLELPGVVLSF